MVSDFVEEQGGFLSFKGNSAQVYLEIQKEGYFNNDKLMVQMENAVNIFDAKYPYARALFLLDNAPSHTKVADDQLCEYNMNASPGGKQPLMRSTVWNDQTHSMVFPEGQAKGLKVVIEERGIDTSRMKANEMRLSSFEDFTTQKTILQDYVEKRGHICIFPPKYHCEY